MCELYTLSWTFYRLLLLSPDFNAVASIHHFCGETANLCVMFEV